MGTALEGGKGGYLDAEGKGVGVGGGSVEQNA